MLRGADFEAVADYIACGRAHDARALGSAAARGPTQMSRNAGRNSERRVLVTGAGGFIGHHLCRYLKDRGYWVRGADLKNPEYGATSADEFELLDLRRWENCLTATRGVEEVYALAADMGGMGFISAHHALILHNNALINLHTLDAPRKTA